MSSTSQKKTSHGGKRSGPGRKAKYENAVTIAATVPAEVRNQLDEWATGESFNRSEAVVEAIRRLDRSAKERKLERVSIRSLSGLPPVFCSTSSAKSRSMWGSFLELRSPRTTASNAIGRKSIQVTRQINSPLANRLGVESRDLGNALAALQPSISDIMAVAE